MYGYCGTNLNRPCSHGCFIRYGIIPLAITSLGGAITLGLMGIITPKVVFSGLSDSTVVLFAGMFVVWWLRLFLHRFSSKDW